MTNASIQDWVFWVTGGLLALAGLTLGAWALFWDRSRGRKRCPTCWYDMSGAVATVKDGGEGFVCPECGKAAAGPQRLRRTRRRPAWLCLVVPLLCAAYLSAKVPQVRRTNWTEAVPGWALALFGPADRSMLSSLQRRQFQAARAQQIQTMVIFAGAPAPAVATTIREDLCLAAWDRMESGRLARWESQIWLERYGQSTGGSLLDAPNVPPRWPAGEPIPLLIGRSRWKPDYGGPRPLRTIVRAQEIILVVPAPAHSPLRVPLELRMQDRTVYARRFDVPVDLVADAADAVDRLESPADNRHVQDALDLRIVRTFDTLEVLVKDRCEDERWHPIDYPLTYKVELRCGQRVIGTAFGAASRTNLPWSTWRQLPVEWTPEGAAPLIALGRSARVVVTGDPMQLLRRYDDWPWRGPPLRAWTGSFGLPLEIVEGSDADGLDRMPDVFRRLEIEGR